MKRCEAFLKGKGFKKARWNKCPQGSKEAGYPCYSHEKRGIWIELYLTDDIPFGRVQGGKIKGYSGASFESVEELKKILAKA